LNWDRPSFEDALSSEFPKAGDSKRLSTFRGSICLQMHRRFIGEIFHTERACFGDATDLEGNRIIVVFPKRTLGLIDKLVRQRFT